MEEKRQITVVLAASVEGEVLPCQAIFKGKTKASLPPAVARKCMEEEGHHFTATDTHWSTLGSMKEYVREVLVPYYMEQKEAMKGDLGDKWEEFPCVGILDCWKVGGYRITAARGEDGQA